MKRIILLIISASLSFAIQAQNILLLDAHNLDTVYTNGDTIKRDTTVLVDELLKEFKVKNNKTSAISVKIKRKNISIIPNTTNYLCWLACYTASPQTEYITPDAVTIAAKATSSTIFSGHYTPYGNVGTSLIMYTLFDVSNPSDSAWIFIEFKLTSTSVPSIFATSNYISAPYPIPANTSVNYRYSLKSTSRGYAVLYNILGEEVKRIELISSGTAKIYTYDLKQGAYICTFIVDDKIIRTNRIIVSH